MNGRYSQYKDLVYDIIGAAMKVQSELRWGLLEAVYNEALLLELKHRGIDGEAEKPVHCYYRNQLLKKEYKMDLVVGDVIIELKSVSDIVPAHRAQLFNYLRLTRKPVGLLINFGTPKLQGDRYGFDENTNECVLLDRNMEVVPKEIDWDVEDLYVP